MRQVWTIRRGGPEVLMVREAPDLVPGPGQVRVQVKAAGVNFADILIRQGLYPTAPRLPAVVGYEVAGTIDAVGEGVSKEWAGKRVMALMPHLGGYTSCAAIPEREAILIPDNLTFEEAAAVPVNYLTAWLMLVELAHVDSGQWVLIHSAAGGVGQAAVQICRWRNAHIIGTAGVNKHERLTAAGVQHCIDSQKPDFASEVLKITKGRGVDIALDALGGKALKQSYRCLAPLGRLFTFGVSRMVSGPQRNLLRVLKEFFSTPRFNPLDLLQTSRGVMGVTLECLTNSPEQRGRMLDAILKEVQHGQLFPHVDLLCPFAEAAKAQNHLVARKNFGKVVLIP